MEDRSAFLELGKVLPQAVDIEEGLLGTLLVMDRSLDKVIDILKPESFYKPAHVEIYKAILALRLKREPVDLLTVTQLMKQTGKLEEIGGMFKLTELTSRVTGTANVEHYAALVHEKYLLRELIRLSGELTKQAYEGSDCFDLIRDYQERLAVLSGFDRGTVKHLGSIFGDVLKQIDRNITDSGAITGVATGFDEFDRHSHGLQQGDLIIIAGETSNGKTAIALNIATHAALRGETVVVYSYEMSDRQLASRILAGESNVSSKDILYTKLDGDQIQSVQEGIGKLAEQRIFIDDLESSRYDYLERSIRSMVIREHASLVVVDYLQLIKVTGRNMQKTDQVAQIANDLKNLAKTLNIPIILISQLSRGMNPTPSLARLKGSGDIENAADIIWLVWQPAIYNRDSFECKNRVYDAQGNSHHIIAKGRNIGTTEFALGWEKTLTKFTNQVSEQIKPRF